MFDWFNVGALGIIVSVAIIDGIMSVDNAAAIAAVAQLLPENRRGSAIRFGILAAMVIRVVALYLAFLITTIPAIKIFGAAYLAWITLKHFFGSGEGDGEVTGKSGFWSVIVTIGFIDLSFSIDNIVATVGMSNVMPIVITGVLFSMVVLMFAAQLMERLMRRYPSLEDIAFVIIGFVAVSILVESGWEFGWHAMTIFGTHISAWQPLSWLPHTEINSGAKFAVVASIVAIAIAWEEIKRFGGTGKPKAVSGS